jgi:hypothetical protein
MLSPMPWANRIGKSAPASIRSMPVANNFAASAGANADGCAVGTLACRDESPTRDGDRSRGPHDLDEHSGAAMAVEVSDLPKLVGEGSRENPNVASDLKFPAKVGNAAVIGQYGETFDDALRHGQWPLSAHDERDYPKAPVDATPRCVIRVQRCEEVAREQGSLQGAGAAGMTDSLDDLRHEGAEALAVEVDQCQGFPVGLSLNDVPAFSRPRGLRGSGTRSRARSCASQDTGIGWNVDCHASVF